MKFRLTLFLSLFISILFSYKVSATSFTDLNTIPTQYQSLVTNLQNKGIVTGLTDGSFSPNKTLTRAEFITMLVRANGWTDSGASVTFTDSKDGDWHYTPLKIAFQKGIIQGTGSTSGITANPNGMITRLEMMVILSRVYNSFVTLESTSDTGCPALLKNYTDGNQVPDWGQSYVCAAVFNGITLGTGPNTLGTMNTGSRLQSAIFTDRALSAKTNPPQKVSLSIGTDYLYNGTVNSNGDPDGVGYLYKKDSSGNPIIWVYGNFKNGNPNGLDIVWNTDGSVEYEGMLVDFVREGYGVEYNSDGTIYYTGYWNNDTPVN